MLYLAIHLQVVLAAEQAHDVQRQECDEQSETSRRPVEPRCHSLDEEDGSAEHERRR
jgi:hypothetical protein